MSGRILRFPRKAASSEEYKEYKAAVRQALMIPAGKRHDLAFEFRLEEPEIVLAACEILREQLDSSPASSRDDAEFFYRFLEKPKRLIGLFDEREYFLGEFALIAGTACRLLSRRDEARLWFDRAEAWYRGTVNSTADLARLAYQRLALRMEEGQLDAVMELCPPLVETFQHLGMAEEAVKCHFLQGLALLNTGQPSEAAEVFKDICDECERIRNPKLLAAGFVNLTHAYGLLGDAEKAMEASRNAIPLQRAANDRIGIAKVQWGLGTLLREQGKLSAAIEVYRSSQRELAGLGMRADVAALNLVVADLLIEIGRENEGLREILVALPVIDELKMVPEGMAALSLLHESVRQHKINRQALRDLHGYFEDLKS